MRTSINKQTLDYLLQHNLINTFDIGGPFTGNQKDFLDLDPNVQNYTNENLKNGQLFADFNNNNLTSSNSDNFKTKLSGTYDKVSNSQVGSAAKGIAGGDALKTMLGQWGHVLKDDYDSDGEHHYGKNALTGLKTGIETGFATGNIWAGLGAGVGTMAMANNLDTMNHYGVDKQRKKYLDSEINSIHNTDWGSSQNLENSFNSNLGMKALTNDELQKHTYTPFSKEGLGDFALAGIPGMELFNNPWVKWGASALGASRAKKAARDYNNKITSAMNKGYMQNQIGLNNYNNNLNNKTFANLNAMGGDINIAPNMKGTFTAAATRHNQSVQDFASKVLANKENYSPAMVKKANFARNAAKWHALGGNLNNDTSNIYAEGGQTNNAKTSSSSNIPKIIKKLSSLGYNDTEISGIITNIKAENNGKTDAHGNGAYGLVGWRGSRFEGLKKYAKAKGSDWKNLDTQIEYIDQELRSSELKAYKQLSKSKTAQEAAYNFAKYFERPEAGEAERRAGIYENIKNYPQEDIDTQMLAENEQSQEDDQYLDMSSLLQEEPQPQNNESSPFEDLDSQLQSIRENTNQYNQPQYYNEIQNNEMPQNQYKPIDYLNYTNPYISQDDLLAYGGMINQFADGGDFNNGVTMFNTGGTHEQNPNGGIPQGVDQNGKPNLVEQGEVKYNDFIYSNRVTMNPNLAKQLKLPKRYYNKTYADIAKDIQKESAERPNDPVSKKTLDNNMQQLAQIQEYQKQLEQQQANAEQQQMTQQQSQQMDPNQMSPEEQQAYAQQMAEQGQQAFGGNIYNNDENVFDVGGPEKIYVPGNDLDTQTQADLYNAYRQLKNPTIKGEKDYSQFINKPISVKVGDIPVDLIYNTGANRWEGMTPVNGKTVVYDPGNINTDAVSLAFEDAPWFNNIKQFGTYAGNVPINSAQKSKIDQIEGNVIAGANNIAKWLNPFNILQNENEVYMRGNPNDGSFDPSNYESPTQATLSQGHRSGKELYKMRKDEDNFNNSIQGNLYNWTQFLAYKFMRNPKVLELEKQGYEPDLYNDFISMNNPETWGAELAKAHQKYSNNPSFGTGLNLALNAAAVLPFGRVGSKAARNYTTERLINDINKYVEKVRPNLTEEQISLLNKNINNIAINSYGAKLSKKELENTLNYAITTDKINYIGIPNGLEYIRDLRKAYAPREFSKSKKFTLGETINSNSKPINAQEVRNANKNKKALVINPKNALEKVPELEKVSERDNPYALSTVNKKSLVNELVHIFGTSLAKNDPKLSLFKTNYRVINPSVSRNKLAKRLYENESVENLSAMVNQARTGTIPTYMNTKPKTLEKWLENGQNNVQISSYSNLYGDTYYHYIDKNGQTKNVSNLEVLTNPNKYPDKVVSKANADAGNKIKSWWYNPNKNIGSNLSPFGNYYNNVMNKGSRFAAGRAAAKSLPYIVTGAGILGGIQYFNNKADKKETTTQTQTTQKTQKKGKKAKPRTYYNNIVKPQIQNPDVVENPEDSITTQTPTPTETPVKQKAKNPQDKPSKKINIQKKTNNIQNNNNNNSSIISQNPNEWAYGGFLNTLNNNSNEFSNPNIYAIGGDMENDTPQESNYQFNQAYNSKGNNGKYGYYIKVLNGKPILNPSLFNDRDYNPFMWEVSQRFNDIYDYDEGMTNAKYKKEYIDYVNSRSPEYWQNLADKFNKVNIGNNSAKKWTALDMKKAATDNDMGMIHKQIANQYMMDKTSKSIAPTWQPKPIPINLPTAITPIAKAEAPKKEISNIQNPKIYKEANLKYAPAFGGLVGLLTDKGLDYTFPNNIEKQVQNTPNMVPTTINDYLRYKPMDTSYNLNRLENQNNANRDFIRNQSNGNRATAMAQLANNDYNYNNSIGQVLTSIDDANLKQMQTIGDFNRGTNQYNATAANSSAQANLSANLDKLKYYSTAEGMKQQIKDLYENQKSANLGNIFSSLGQVGLEADYINKLNENPALAFGTRPTYDATFNNTGYNYFKNSKAEGGDLNTINISQIHDLFTKMFNN